MTAPQLLAADIAALSLIPLCAVVITHCSQIAETLSAIKDSLHTRFLLLCTRNIEPMQARFLLPHFKAHGLFSEPSLEDWFEARNETTAFLEETLTTSPDELDLVALLTYLRRGEIEHLFLNTENSSGLSDAYADIYEVISLVDTETAVRRLAMQIQDDGSLLDDMVTDLTDQVFSTVGHIAEFLGLVPDTPCLAGAIAYLRSLPDITSVSLVVSEEDYPTTTGYLGLLMSLNPETGEFYEDPLEIETLAHASGMTMTSKPT